MPKSPSRRTCRVDGSAALAGNDSAFGSDNPCSTIREKCRYGSPPGCQPQNKEAIVPVVTSPYGYNEDQLYVDLRPTLGHPLFLKCEGFNFAGSIKLKAATEMVEAAERDGTLQAGFRPGRVLVRKSGCGAEHDRGQQGLPLPLRDGPPLQPHDQADDGSARRPGSRHRPTGPGGAAWSAPESTTSAPSARQTTAMSGSTSTRTRATGWRTTVGPRRRSPASSRNWTCFSSEQGPPGP